MAVGSNRFKSFLNHTDGQAYINVPFTADTMPAGSTQVDLLRTLLGGDRS